MNLITFAFVILFMFICFVLVIALTALNRADKVLGMDTNEDLDSEMWRELLFEKFKERQKEWKKNGR